MRNKPRFINKKRNISASFFDKIVSIIKVIRIELLVALLALAVSLGQYFQHSINARINITETWRNGYTSEIRNRVNRFTYFYKQAKTNCSENELKHSIDIIADTSKLYNEGDKISEDCFIKNLVANEIAAIKNEKSKETIEYKGITRDEYIEIVLKYKNAIIECLNTLEAVKAVIQSKPLPFRINIFYKDTLEGRYKDIIEELRDGLMDFIDAYRKSHSDRETEAWYVLTSDESYLNDLFNVVLYFLVFTASLVLIYMIKTRMQKLGYLPK